MLPNTQLALFGGEPLMAGSPPRPQWPLFDQEDERSLVEHLRSEDLSAYEVVDGPIFEFEAELCRFFDSRHALAVANGTSALYSAFSGLQLNPEDEVVVPACTFPATGSPLLHLGARVRIADVDADTGNPSVENIKAAITANTKAVVVAHAWGIPADMARIVPFLKDRGIALVEDGARAFGSRSCNRLVGTFGIAGCFSFHELKAVSGGEGGVLITSNHDMFERSVALGHYYRLKVDRHVSNIGLRSLSDSGAGLNLQIHPLSAVLCRNQLRRLPARLANLADNFRRIVASCAAFPGLNIQAIPGWAQTVSHYGFNFHWNSKGQSCMPSRATLIRAIRAEGLQVSTPGNPPLYKLPLFRSPALAGLRGRMVGPRNDRSFPGAVAHQESLIRFPSLWEAKSPWVEQYERVLNKVFHCLPQLFEWEEASRT